MQRFWRVAKAGKIATSFLWPDFRWAATLLDLSGTLTQRSPGIWLIRVEAPRDAVTGLRRRVAKTVLGSRKYAQRVLNELAVEVDRGKYQEMATTVNQLVCQ